MVNHALELLALDISVPAHAVVFQKIKNIASLLE